MARTLICTSYPRSWLELAKITCKTHKAWADLQGYDYHADCSDKVQDNFPIRGFIKFELLLYFLRDYDVVCWLDADLLVTNPEIPLERFTVNVPHGIITGADHNGTHTTVIIARKHPTVVKFLLACNGMGRNLFLKHPLHEMESFKHFAKEPTYPGLVGYRSVKELCPILAHEYVKHGQPLEASGEYAWEPGDFALHLSALSLERRIELAREYAQKAGVA